MQWAFNEIYRKFTKDCSGGGGVSHNINIACYTDDTILITMRQKKQLKMINTVVAESEKKKKQLQLKQLGSITEMDPTQMCI